MAVPVCVTRTKGFGCLSVVEFVCGFLGFLGIGWMVSGNILRGLLYLLGWWGLMFALAALTFFTGGLGGVCWAPLQIIVPLASALQLSGEPA